MPTLARKKKAIWHTGNNKAISLLAMHSKVSLVQESHCHTWLGHRFLWNENLQWKQNWTVKSTNHKENTGKVKSVFVIRAALWAEKLGRCLECCRSWKNSIGKLAVVVSTVGHLNRIWNEISISDGGHLCPLWLMIHKSVWYSVADTL